jgi:hypothetical protein
MPGLGATIAGLSSVDITQFISLTANFTLTDSNSAQKAFNATANGALTVLPSTAYLFESAYFITNTGTTSHTWAVLFGGTATFSAGSIVMASGLSATAAPPAASALQGYTTTPGSAMVVTAASVSATENVTVFLNGRLNINAAGTLIPQLQLSAATTGVETMLAGSYFRIWPIGPSTITTNGPWS